MTNEPQASTPLKEKGTKERSTKFLRKKTAKTSWQILDVTFK